MPLSRRSPDTVAFPFLAPATVALATGVFVADTISKTDIAVAALYAAVVLIAARFCRPRLVVGVAVGCTALVILSYLLSPPGGPQSEGFINSAISIAVVGFTTALALQSQSDEVRLREQASLLDLTHDSIFVRGMDDVVTYWNRGAEELYGWSPAEAVGK